MAVGGALGGTRVDLHGQMCRSADDFITRGDVQHASHDLIGALASYARAVALEPADAEAWTSHGNVLRELKQPAAAAASYLKALDAEPDDADLWHYRGVALFAAGCYFEAAESYENAIRLLRSKCAEANILADMLICHGNALDKSAHHGPSAALEVYACALALMPAHAAAAINHANTLARLFWASAGSSALLVTAPLLPYHTAGLPLIEAYPRNPLHSLHLCHWIDEPACAWIVDHAEAHAKAHGGWSAVRSHCNMYVGV